jgi:hypothetical protein
MMPHSITGLERVNMVSRLFTVYLPNERIIFSPQYLATLNNVTPEPRTDPSGCVVLDVGLWQLACSKCGFESLRDIDACLFCMLCVFRQSSLCRADHSSR